MPEPSPPLENTVSATQYWLENHYAQHCWSAERRHWQQALKQIAGPKVLQIGRILEQQVIAGLDLPQLILSVANAKRPSTNDVESDLLAADPAFLPFQPESISSVILPHVLEGHELPHQVLREVHRVLVPDGCLILTGFNPYSIMGVQRRLGLRSVLPGQYYSLKRVIDWLQLLGLEVVGSAMYQYAPLSKSPRLNSSFNFINAIGDRWLPMFGGGYMITAKKREASITLVGKVKFSRSKSRISAPSPAKISLKPKL